MMFTPRAHAPKWRRPLLRPLVCLFCWISAGCNPNSSDPGERPSAPAPVPSRPGDGATGAGQTAPLIAREEVIPGKLSVGVYSHTIQSHKGPVPSWTYVSEGLWPLGQKEIVITVKREPGEGEKAFPRDLMNLYATLHDLAAKKKIVHAGGYSELRSGLLGREDFRCLMYTRAQPLNGIPVASPYLTALIVTCNELRAAQDFGYTRVMALIGSEYRFYPTAPWADRKRAELIGPDGMKGSVLEPMARMSLSDVMVRKEGADRIVMTVLPGAKEKIKELFTKHGADEGLVSLVGMDPAADSCLVWSPGQQQPRGISKPGASGHRLAGNFIVLIPKQAKSGGHLVEDGFVVTLTAAAWGRAREALLSGTPFSMKGDDQQLGFEIVWEEEGYDSLLDGKRYVAEGGFQTYFPEGVSSAAPRASGAIDVVKNVVLLTSEEEIAQRIDIKALADFTGEAMDAVEEKLNAMPPNGGHHLLVEFEVKPGGVKAFAVATRPEVKGPLVSELYARLEKIKPPEVRGGPVKFQVIYQLNGGSGLPPSKLGP